MAGRDVSGTQGMPARPPAWAHAPTVFSRELAELAEFCTQEKGPSYTWLQGPAWTGKSALMAAFVQNPPPNVRPVSFFISAHHAGRGHRAAFLEAVLPQLTGLTGDPLPEVLTEAHRVEWFLRLLDEAGRLCAAEGGRLVLVVDGLDADRHATRSIAALLPGSPPEGVRVIVTGRPDAPVPENVPSGHPLRDPGVIRPLEPSRAAAAARDDAHRELTGLLEEGGLGRELVGLLATTGGALSGNDLAELTGHPVADIERILNAGGRSFVASGHRNEPVFALAHAELARNALDPQEVGRWRKAVHDWAERYRREGWPAGTPAYLLHGYLSMLLEAGDLERMRALVTDWPRMNRMLDATGGDAAALADLTTVQEYIRDQDDPDLAAALHLAWTRHHLIRRNDTIPTDLPAVWALLGHPNRAEAHARSNTDPFTRARALSELVKVLATDRADQIATTAESTASTIAEQHLRAQALGRLIEALVQIGRTDRAENIARSITDPSTQAEAMGALARALAEKGHLNRAAQIAHSITSPNVGPQALSALAQALAHAGRTDEAENIARAITHPDLRAQALSALIRALAQAGRTDQAVQIATTAATIARTTIEPHTQAETLSTLAQALAHTGRIDQAENIARTITDPDLQAWALSSLVRVLVEAGRTDRAKQLATTIDTLTRTITGALRRTPALSYLAQALAHTGRIVQAENIARTITRPDTRSETLAALAHAAAQAGHIDRAESIARAIPHPYWQAETLTELVRTLAQAGRTDRAHHLATTITDPLWKTEALSALARSLAEAGHRDEAARIATTAERLAHTFTNPRTRPQALSALARALVLAGRPAQAESIATTIDHPYWRAEALSAVSQAAPPAHHTKAAVEASDRKRRLAAVLIDEQIATVLEDVARIAPEAVINTAHHANAP